MSVNTGDDWVEYKRLVLAQLESLEREVKGMDKTLHQIHNDLTAMKVKAGLLGAFTSALTTGAAALLWWISKQ